MIKAVIFDVDGVLLDSYEASFKWIRDIAQFLNLKAPNRAAYLKSFYYVPTREILREYNIIENMYELEQKLTAAREKIPSQMLLLKFFENCNQTIKQLHKKYKLAIVSNRTKQGLDVYLKFSKNKKYFKTIVCLDDVTHHKPHPEGMLLALQRLRVKSTEAVYVGDAPADVQAAHAADMKAIIMNPKRIPGADVRITHFNQLIPALERLR